MAKKSIRATVEELDGSEVVLDVNGREARFPRSAFDGLVVGDVVTFEVKVDHSGAARDEVAAGMDAKVGRVRGKRGSRNPLGTSTRVAKK